MTPEQHYLEALVAELREAGALDDSALVAIAGRLSAIQAVGTDAATLRDMAHGLRVGLIETGAPSAAERNRATFRVVDGSAP